MNKYRKKTIATLLIAIFMISTFSVAYAAIDGEHLVATGPPAGNEDKIVITMPVGFTLGDLETLSWMAYLEEGYPAHVDITLDTLDPDQSMLTAEYAVNNPDYPTIEYGAWTTTFQDGIIVDDDCVFWVTKMGSGDLNAPSGTLAIWKAGTGYTDPDTELLTTEISASTPVLMLEIEVDNWIMDTEVYVKDIEINEVAVSVFLSGWTREPFVSFSVAPTSIDFGELVLGKEYYDWPTQFFTVDNLGETDILVTAQLLNDDGFYAESLYLGVGIVDQLVADFITQINEANPADVGYGLTISRDAELGVHDALLVFWAEEIT